jgi:heat shock protein HtpX
MVSHFTGLEVMLLDLLMVLYSLSLNQLFILIFSFSVGFFILLIELIISLVYFSDRIILRWYSAKSLNDPKIEEIVKSISKKASINSPRLYVVTSNMPNLFSVGKGSKNASLVLTSSVLALLDEEELKCALAHELYHIKKGLRRRTVAATFAGIITSISTLAFWFSLLLGFGNEDDPAPNLIRKFAISLGAPHSALIVSLARGEEQETKADSFGAKFCSSSNNLSTALMKIGVANYEINPGHAHLFFAYPLRKEIFNSLFETHPTNDYRIKRLKERDS